MRNVCSLCLLLIVAIAASAEKYKIVKLSSATVTIGGKNCQVGSVFDDQDEIRWATDDQGFWARNMSKGTFNFFAAKAFKSRKCKTAFEYLRTNKMSTRSGGFDLTVERTGGSGIQDKRIALVIGNANYMAEKNLSTPIPDALAISEKLSELGFNVYVVFDAGKAVMNEAVKRFCGFAINYETALIYYAGHGSQHNNDTYLLPVDAVVETSYDVDQSCVPAKRVVSFLNDVKSLKTRLLLIDACRTTNNLLASRGETDDNMLNTDELKEGVVIYSTKHGYVAYDEDGPTAEHSPFASAVIKHIATPNVSVPDFITDVMNEVKQLTSRPPYPHPQEPRSLSTLTHRFFFRPMQEKPAADAATVMVRPTEKAERETGSESVRPALANPTTPEGFYETGMSYYNQKDYKNAVSWFIKSASANYAPAQAVLGICYHEGWGVDKDYSIARDYYEKAAKQNNGKAINGLGRLYKEGLGVEKNVKKAMKHFERAAKLGYGAGYFNLGYIYYSSEDVKVDYEKAFQMFEAGAKLQYSDCMGLLGYMCQYGQGTVRNMEKAIEWYNKGVEQGDEMSAYLLGILYRDGNNSLIKNPERAAKMFAKCGTMLYGQYELAKCYRDGFGVEKDLKQAAELFLKAAEQGYDEAQYETGNCYLNGKGFAKNEKEAVQWYEKAALQGNANAQNSMGYCYSCSKGVANNDDIAYAWFRKSAEQGNVVAIYNIGWCYENARGVRKNMAEAVKWYTQAAEREYSSGQYSLGLCYEYGTGVDKDELKAAEWYFKAAQQGHMQAQNKVGECLYYGKGFQKNVDQAFTWWMKSAEQGYAAAQHWVGLSYEFEYGVKKNMEEAVKWYTKAANQGNIDAKSNLAYCYYNGNGIAKDFKQAFSLWQQAAEKGQVTAQFNVGICYENGNGVTKDLTKALEWYEKAAAQNHESAIKARDRLKK